MSISSKIPYNFIYIEEIIKMNRERIGLIVSIIGILLITLGVLYPLNYISHQTYIYIFTPGWVSLLLGIAIRPERKKKSSKK